VAAVLNLHRRDIANVQVAVRTQNLGDLAGKVTIDAGGLVDPLAGAHFRKGCPQQSAKISPKNRIHHQWPVQ
jgi:hypothetical protein